MLATNGAPSLSFALSSLAPPLRPISSSLPLPRHQLLCLFSGAVAISTGVIDIILGVGSSLSCIGYFGGGQLGLNRVGGPFLYHQHAFVCKPERVRLSACAWVTLLSHLERCQNAVKWCRVDPSSATRQSVRCNLASWKIHSR